MTTYSFLRKGAEGQGLISALCDRAQWNSMVLHQRRLSLGIRKKFFTTGHWAWNRLCPGQ